MFNFSNILNLILSMLCIYLIYRLIRSTSLIREHEQEIKSFNELIKYKSDFIATMAHEIRTPLNGITVAGALLVDEDNMANSTELIDIIKNSSDLLSNVFNDILDFSIINTGQLELDYQSFSLGKCVDDVICSFSNQYKSKGLYLNHHIDSDIVDTIYSDEARIKQIFYNLLGNALKFTSDGGVQLYVMKSNDEIIFSVKDSGVGLTNSQIGSIFSEDIHKDEFNQASYSGTRLGLSITQKLVHKLGGSLKISSECGNGAEFIFNIKLVELPENLQEQSSEEVSGINNYQDLKVLVVDDNAINRKVAELAFKKMNIVIDLAVDGNQAVDKALETKYDIIFMDIQMPNKNGVEATEELSRKVPASDMPLIFALSASSFMEVKVRCFKVGMSGFLSKPLNISELNKPLDQALNRKIKNNPN
jgi:CheY-like chemotaxis protein